MLLLSLETNKNISEEKRIAQNSLLIDIFLIHQEISTLTTIFPVLPFLYSKSAFSGQKNAYTYLIMTVSPFGGAYYHFSFLQKTTSLVLVFFPQTRISDELFNALWSFKILIFFFSLFYTDIKKEIKDEKNNFVQILGT